MSLAFFIDDQALAVVDCLDLPEAGTTLPCTVDAGPHEIEAQITAITGDEVGYSVTVELDLVGLDDAPTEMRMDVTLPDDTDLSSTAEFDEVETATNPFPTSETCPDRICLVAPLFAGWDDPSIGDGTTTGG